MEIELLMRAVAPASLEDTQDYKTASLLPNFDEEMYEQEHPPQFIYHPVTIDIRTALPYNQVDEDHTRIYLDSGMTFVAKIPYETFKAIRMTMTGSVVKTMADFKLTKTIKR